MAWVTSNQEPVGLMTLNKWPLDEIVIACRDCDYTATYSKTDLALMFGPDQDLALLIDTLKPTDCDVAVCRPKYHDADLVDAILEDDRAAVQKPDLIEQAMPHRQRLGIKWADYQQGFAGGQD